MRLSCKTVISHIFNNIFRCTDILELCYFMRLKIIISTLCSKCERILKVASCIVRWCMRKILNKRGNIVSYSPKLLFALIYTQGPPGGRLKILNVTHLWWIPAIFSREQELDSCVTLWRGRALFYDRCDEWTWHCDRPGKYFYTPKKAGDLIQTTFTPYFYPTDNVISDRIKPRATTDITRNTIIRSTN